MKTTVTTPKLRKHNHYLDWRDSNGGMWMCGWRLRHYYELEDAEAIQFEVSDAPLRDGHAWWFAHEENWIACGDRSSLKTEDCLYFRPGNLLDDNFNITETPTKLYVRLLLLTGADAEGE